MGKVIATVNVTLDGVMQAPGRSDEDIRGAFTHGGWAVPYNAMTDAGSGIANMGALLLGRWTYQSFFDFWPKQVGNPFREMLENLPKFVASNTLNEAEWKNSTLLTGNVSLQIREIKGLSNRDLVIFGSGTLIRSLAASHDIDEYIVLIHPLVLGSGRRLFDGATTEGLQLVNSQSTSRGVIAATYRPSGKP